MYDEKYLQQIDQLVNWATDAGLYVLLDMHQDLYGQKFSDGAPDWASLDQGLPHFHGAVWSDSYMISPAVQACFDNFWDNALAPDELGVQDHYVNMWKMLAERYKNDRGIIGFDLMNEPFMGSQAQQVMPLMIQAFESDILNPFYQKLRDSIRTVNTNHILFLEHNYFANTGIPSAIEIPLNENGEKDPLVAYAAHGYDLVTDTKEVGSPSSARVDFIFRRIKKKADELNVPLLVGEWGAYGGDHPIYAETSAFIMSLFEEFGCSHTYWNYGGKDFAQKAYFPVLTRAFPIEVSAYPRK